jgi:hypothetical protein
MSRAVPSRAAPSRAVATFGLPARAYRYGGDLILVWPRGTNLLARLS